MPLTTAEVTELERGRSNYGCGNDSCMRCYPIQYACAHCGISYENPIANGEIYTCPECDYTDGENN